MPAYKTAAKNGEAEFTEKKSRFIGHLAPVSSEEEALAFLERIRAENRTANHNVFAYRLREQNLERASDDGEPQGTAGVPALKVLQGKELVDCCLVVTRYFGGTLLGTGGLARAYAQAALLACEAAGTLTMAETLDYVLETDYAGYGRLEHYAAEEGIRVLGAEFGGSVILRLRILSEEVPSFEHDIAELTNGAVKPVLTGKGWNAMEPG
jgi:uncharacterized YigZ family protein